MPIPGQTMRKYCSICGCETCWEYILVQLEDGVLGIQNLVSPEAHQIRFWRCLNHTAADGRMLPRFKNKKRAVAGQVE